MTNVVLRMSEVLKSTKMSRATLYRRIDEGKFPKPVKNGRISVWRESVVKEFIDSLEVAS